MKDNKLGEDIRNVMRYWGSGVAIATASVAADRHGMTVSSFVSLSLEPPLVMVSVKDETRTFALINKARAFGISILDETQQDVSNRFAGRETELSDRFAGMDVYAMKTGAPLLVDGLAQIDCKVVAEYDAGTQTVFIGEVVAVKWSPDADDKKPLLYYNRAYREID